MSKYKRNNTAFVMGILSLIFLCKESKAMLGECESSGMASASMIKDEELENLKTKIITALINSKAGGLQGIYDKNSAIYWFNSHKKNKGDMEGSSSFVLYKVLPECGITLNEKELEALKDLDTIQPCEKSSLNEKKSYETRLKTRLKKSQEKANYAFSVPAFAEFALSFGLTKEEVLEKIEKEVTDLKNGINPDSDVIRDLNMVSQAYVEYPEDGAKIAKTIENLALLKRNEPVSSDCIPLCSFISRIK